MAKTQTGIGIDIGASAIRAVVLRKRGTHVSLVRAGTIELGDLAFLDDSERKEERVAELLRALLRLTRIRGGTVATGLAGRDYFVKYLHVPPATPEKLRKIIEYEVGEDPTAPRQQTSDFWLLDLPTKAEDFTVLVAMARNETLHDRLKLLRKARLRTAGPTLNAIGLLNAYVHSMDESIYNDRTTLLVNIGARHMDVVIQRNAKLLFVRNLTLGGQRFSEAVQEEFRLPIKEAEELKITQGALLPRHFDAAAEIDTEEPEAHLSAALLEPAEAVYDTLQATIKYAQTQTRIPDLRIDEIALTGRCSCLRGLREFLANRFRLPVEPLDPFRSISTAGLPAGESAEVLDDEAGYAIAVGLALREIDERPIQPIALLPEDVRRRSEFFARDACLYAAAAAFFLAFATMIYSSSIAAAKAQHDLGKEKDLIQAADTAATDFEAHKLRNDILAAQAEALKRLFDTGRRCSEAIAVLKQKTPRELRLDAITTTTENPAALGRVITTAPGQPELTTHLLVEGRVAEKYQDREITEAAAKNIVDNFLVSLLDEKRLFSRANVTQYPQIKVAEGPRTFKMVVYFAAPFYGGQELATK